MMLEIKVLTAVRAQLPEAYTWGLTAKHACSVEVLFIVLLGTAATATQIFFSRL